MASRVKELADERKYVWQNLSVSPPNPSKKQEFRWVSLEWLKLYLESPGLLNVDTYG